MNHFEKQVLQGRGRGCTAPLRAPTRSEARALPRRGPGPAHSPAHGVPRVTQVEQQAAVLGLVAAVGGLCQVEEGRLDASSDALHHLLTQRHVWDLPEAAGDRP